MSQTPDPYLWLEDVLGERALAWVRERNALSQKELTERPEYAPMAKSLREIGMNSAVDLFSTYAGRKPDLEPWLRDATLNRDRNLRPVRQQRARGRRLAAAHHYQDQWHNGDGGGD